MLTEYKKELAKNGQVYLRIKAIPGSAKTEIKGEMADKTIKIALAAAPEKGKANQTLIDFLAEEFGVPRGSANIISGATARIKLVKITRNT
ncbi:MAG: DUF167 domain-containing protein [Patescibacteria group bacterium]|nr:DUF167 domain-containing protein [Patescibacteria group bacterium]